MAGKEAAQVWSGLYLVLVTMVYHLGTPSINIANQGWGVKDFSTKEQDFPHSFTCNPELDIQLDSLQTTVAQCQWAGKNYTSF